MGAQLGEGGVRTRGAWSPDARRVESGREQEGGVVLLAVRLRFCVLFVHAESSWRDRFEEWFVDDDLIPIFAQDNDVVPI